MTMKRILILFKKKAYLICILIFTLLVGLGGVGSYYGTEDSVLINEICTSNVACCEDENGDYPDWIELYNPTSRDIDLSNYTVNKSVKRNKEKYVFPEGTILASGAYLLFDPKFTLPSEGCVVNLLDEMEKYVDRVNVPGLRYDTTFARDNDGGSKWTIKSPTPGYENSDGVVIPPTIEGSVYASVDSGFYDEEFDVKLESSNLWRTVYYTTDGSDPVKNGTRYEGAIHIYDRTKDDNVYSVIPEVSEHYMSGETRLPSYKVDKCTVIRAVAVDYLGRYTDISTYTYFVGYGNKDAYDNMAVITVTAEPDDLFSNDRGIMVLGDRYAQYVAAGSPEEYEAPKANFTQRGRGAEREISIEIFDENHNQVLKTKGGLRIKGLSSRWDVQKSFYVFFRKAYGGASKEYFSVDGCNFGYHSIAIDKGGQEVWSKMKDTIMERCMEDTGCATTDRIPCCLFLNGEYNGFYWLTERFDQSYISDRYGVVKENVEFKERGDFETYDEWIDDDFDQKSLMDYYAANIIVSHEGDWPDYNFSLWKTSGDEGTEYGDGKWRPVIYDVNSVSMEKPEFEMFEHLSEGFYPFRDVSENREEESEKFRKNLVARIDEMSANEFEKGKVLNMIDELYGRINGQMVLDIMRYSDCSESEAQALFNENVGIIRNFFENRWVYLDEQKEEFINDR